MRSSILLCTLFLLSANLFAQTPPASDIFLVNLDSSGTPVNLTNRPGYDNQPFFVDDNILLYTSIREDNQADIYRFDLQTDSGTRLTATSESEYSPMTMPGSEFFSVVRVEADS
ncbi:MAG TPA: hypothetical protein VGA99_06630, partial [bacterium]